MKLKGPAIAPVAIVLGGVVLAGLLILTGPRVQPSAPAATAPLVRALEITPRELQLNVHTHGTVVPRTESDLVPEVSGPVTWVSPALVSGGFFALGEALLRIDARDYQVALEQVSARLARAESEQRRAAKELTRQRGLAERRVASAAQLDDAENAARVAEAMLREARASLSRAERDLERTEIVAPYDGRVRSESVDVGQFISRGAPVAKLFAVDYAEIRLPVPDEELAFLDLPLLYREDAPGTGPEVILRARFAGAEHEWRARVVRTEGELDPKSRMVNVVARLQDPYARNGERPPLSVGLFVAAEILGDSIASAVVLPRSALREGDQVFVIDAEGRLRSRDVDVLRIVGDEVVVRSGLDAGERVCISALQSAIDGMRVRIAPDGEVLS
jgi:RND family efflux transporter MFP subunit